MDIASSHGNCYEVFPLSNDKQNMIKKYKKIFVVDSLMILFARKHQLQRT